MEIMVEYNGDGLYDINGITCDTFDIAKNIAEGQDGNTVSEIVRDYSHHSCEYHGADLWKMLDGEEKDEEEMATLMSEIFDDLQEHVMAQIIEDYYTPRRGN